MSHWYKKMFEGNLVKYWLSVSDDRKETTNVQVSFLNDVLAKGLVLDHCCGPGRLSIPLSVSMSVVGVNLSMYLLRAAKKRARQTKIENFFLIRANMRYLPFRPKVFDHVINFWTSFGYFSEEENKAVLREIASVLKSEGTFVLDIGNPGWLVRNFKERDWTEEEKYLSLEHRSVDWKTNRWKSKWIVVNKQTKEIDEINFDHRVYDLQELREMVKKKGRSGNNSDTWVIQKRGL